MKLSAPIYQLKRQAKVLSRNTTTPLNVALNSIAKQEGFKSWGLLAASHAESGPATKIFAALNPGDLVLLGARPGHGKTLLGLEVIVEALKTGNSAAFFTLEYTREEVGEHLTSLGARTEPGDGLLMIDASDEICADYIVEKLASAPRGSVVVIDYLQLLDQDRTKPALIKQMSALRSFAGTVGLSVIILSQIDRAYDAAAKPLPGMSDVRLPNPLDLNLFTKSVFLNNGEVNFQTVA